MAMASYIIQIGRTSCQSELQERLPTRPTGEDVLSLYSNDSSDGVAVLGLFLIKRLGKRLHVVRP